MSTAVLDIIKRIEQLSDEDRLTLERYLAELAESDWKAEAEVARQAAREQGLTQEAIDRAIEEMRYGS